MLPKTFPAHDNRVPAKNVFDMDIEINGRSVHITEGVTTLGAALRAEGFTGVGQAVAVENRVVPRTAWDETPLKEGMKVTVIRAVCGG